KEGYLQHGMYAEVTIHLEKASRNAFTVPSICLHKDHEPQQLYVVRDGLTCVLPVRVGNDDGSHAEILTNLRATDPVIIDHLGPLRPGVAVEPVEIPEDATH